MIYNFKGEVAGSGIMFFLFFLMIVIVGGGIVLGVYAFYGEDYDFRDVETGILFNNVRDCLGKEEFEDDFDIYTRCRLNKNYFDGDALVLIKENDQNGIEGENGNEFFWGVRSYETQCELNGGQFPRCKEGEVELGGKKYILIVGTNKQSRGAI